MNRSLIIPSVLFIVQLAVMGIVLVVFWLTAMGVTTSCKDLSWSDCAKKLNDENLAAYHKRQNP